MPVLFSTNPGKVIAVQDPATIGMISGVNLQGWGGFGAMRSIITRVTISNTGNFQFLHTLGNQIFVYVFGDRMGQFSIAGLAFDNGCRLGLGQPLGIEAVAAYYAANRLANRASPLLVSIGLSTPAQCLLIGMTSEVVDPNARVYQFNMMFGLVPPVSASSFNGRMTQGFGNGNATQGSTLTAGGSSTTPPSSGLISEPVLTNITQQLDAQMVP